MSDINSVVLVGRLGREAELQTSKAGKEFAKFSIAVNSGYGENVSTSWVDCIAFNASAKYICKLPKGSRVGVSGSLEIREYTNREGVKKHTTTVMVRDLQGLSDAPKKANGEQQAKRDVTIVDYDDSLPFDDF